MQQTFNSYSDLTAESLEALKQAQKDHDALVSDRLHQPIDKMTKSLKSLLVELRNSGKINSTLAFSLAPFAIAVATQGRIKARAPNGSLVNLNMMIELIGPPGSGKTRTINHMLRANLEHEAERKKKHEETRAQQIQRKAVLRIRKQKLEREYLKCEHEQEKFAIETEIEKMALELAQTLPTSSCHILNSATRSGIIRRLNENKGELTVVVNEGFEFINNCMINGISFFCEMYDNNPYARATSEDGLTDIENVNFNMLVAVQNGVASRQHTRHFDRWNESGFNARLYCTIYETGLEGGLKSEGHHSEENYNQFLLKVKQLYERTESPETQVLELSEDLGEKIQQFCEEYPLGNLQFTDAARFIDRIELHIVKLSALFTLLEDVNATQISEKAFISARYMFDYFAEMQHIIANEEHVYNRDAIALEAKRLLHVIENIVRDQPGSFAYTSLILARAPSHRRTMPALQPLLDYLAAHGKIERGDTMHRQGYYLCATE